MKIHVPGDLDITPDNIGGNGLFKSASGGESLASSEWLLQRADSPSPSITLRACNHATSVGRAPSGSLLIDKISTPLSIRDSGRFYVSVFKDEQLLKKIAEIETGVYIESTNLSPGTVTAITLTPLAREVQRTTTHTVTFRNEHRLDESAQVWVVFPPALGLPPPGSTMEVRPVNFSITATEGQVFPGNELRIPGVFAGMDPLPGAAALPYLFQFEVVGITNQPSADDAGPIAVTTWVGGGDGTGTPYKVDSGSAPATFVAETGLVAPAGDIEVLPSATCYGDDSTYVLRFRCASAVPVGGRIRIYIPEPIEMLPNQVPSSGTCATATCHEVPEERLVVWTLGLGQEVAKDEEVVFRLAGVRNPRTTQTTGTFFVTTFAPGDLESEIDSGYEVSTQMQEEGQLGQFDASPRNRTNGAEDVYEFSVRTEIPLLEGDRLSFSLPAQLTAPSAASELNCLPGEGLARISCSIAAGAVTITLEELTRATGTFKWTFDNIGNPPTLERSDKFGAISVVDKHGYGVAKLDGDATEGIENLLTADILVYEPLH